MTSPKDVCLFHNRKQYSSNTQCILNLFRVNVIKINCNLNLIAKQSLCTCQLSHDELQIADDEFNKQQQKFYELQTCPWFEEVDEIIQKHIMKKCDSKITLYKLFKLICEISNEEKFSKKFPQEEKVYTTQSNPIRRCIELTLPPCEIGHLLGRDGRFHKQIMSDTKTHIHFDNAPYSVKLSSKRNPEFDLELFQSSSTRIKATIIGDTSEAVENAVKALENHDRDVKNKLSRLNQE